MKKIVGIVLVIILIFVGPKVLKVSKDIAEDISHNNSMNNIELSTIKICEKYNIPNPNFSVEVNVQYESAFVIDLNLNDKRIESLSDEDKYNLINEIRDISVGSNIN